MAPSISTHSSPTRLASALVASMLLGLSSPVLAGPPPPPFQIPNSNLLTSVSACQALQTASGQVSSAASGMADGGVADAPPLPVFDTGVCLYHLLKESTDCQALLDTLAVLQTAQTRGLDRSRQAAAGLLEGLTACQLARVELNPSASTATAQSPLFCLARSAAQAAFSSLQLQELRISYESSSLSVETLMATMTACYATDSGPLNRQFAAGCGIYAGLDQAGIAAVATSVFDDISTRYLLGASAPITAMFTRKRQMAEGGLRDTQQSIDALKADASRIQSDYEMELGLYKELAAPVDALVKGYQETSSVSSAVLKQYDAWKQGLFEQKTPVVLSYTQPLLDRTAAVKDLTLEVDRATALVDNSVTTLQTHAALTGPLGPLIKSARAMCRGFFCELAVNQGFGFGTPSSYTKVCNRLLHPLCTLQKTKLNAGGVAFTQEEFCTAAQFPSKFIKYGMSRAESNTCWLESQ